MGKQTESPTDYIERRQAEMEEADRKLVDAGELKQTQRGYTGKGK